MKGNVWLASVHFNRGKAYQALGKYEEAFADLSAAIELNPKKSEYWAARGYLRLEYINAQKKEQPTEKR